MGRVQVQAQTKEEQARPGTKRTLPIGGEVLPDSGAHFRVWAPCRGTVSVVLEEAAGPIFRPKSTIQLAPEGNGYFSGAAPGASRDDFYRFQLGDQQQVFPDPASRFQPQGPHGPSQLVDPSCFRWNDSRWRGISGDGQIIYEMHVGTFTREGTWKAAAEQLPELARLGVTIIEVMPVADFPGGFGWGYDGVNLFAPTRLYGTPDDFRGFIDHAHGLGIGVILDVVYNHVGPDGNYLKEFSPDYFTDRYQNEWGEALNFDGPNSAPVREFFVANARYWIQEFHLDGLRLDATQQIFDASEEHILATITREVRQAANGRGTFIVAENEPQHTRLVRPVERGGYGMDALWNDDWHHSAVVALTGRREAYYTDYKGKPQEFVSAAKRGFLYQGQRYKWQKQRRGTPTFGVKPAQFVAFLQNHDQVANSLRGHRVHHLTSPGRYRAMTALLLLGPGTPMLFQGQEFASSSPFLYFADHNPDLAKLVREGRQKFLSQFPSCASGQCEHLHANPSAGSTFQQSKLDLTEREKHAAPYQMHGDLIRLRREDPVIRSQRPDGVDGAPLSESSFVLRFFEFDGEDRLLLVNLGADLHLDPAPEPLLAPPVGSFWELAWSSEDPRYGGLGTPPLESDENWRMPAECAILMIAKHNPESENGTHHPETSITGDQR
jgi:maltooligosyltrehalose trehalohydrolase